MCWGSGCRLGGRTVVQGLSQSYRDSVSRDHGHLDCWQRGDLLLILLLRLLAGAHWLLIRVIGSLPRGSLHRVAHNMAAFFPSVRSTRKRERRTRHLRQKPRSSCNLNFVSSQGFCHIPFIRSKSVSSIHTERERIAQRQEVGIIEGPLRGCLPCGTWPTPGAWNIRASEN